MEYSHPDEGSYYRPPPYPQQHQQPHTHAQPQQVYASAPSHPYTAQSDQLSPPPTPHSATPHMTAPGSYAGSQDSHEQSYMTARPAGEASSSRGTISPGESRSGPSSRAPTVKKTGAKANVSAACGPCKKAHLACDVQRPCKRCTNMGKEDMCEDVPHKKRGRPKVNKVPLSTPYERSRLPLDTAPQYRQTMQPSYPPPPPGTYDPSYHTPYYANAPPPLVRIPSPQSAGSDPPNLFTLFTSTDLRILRVSNGSWPLTGYAPQSFYGHSLLDWLHPEDRHLMDDERIRLLTLSNSTSLPNSNRNILESSIPHRSERELVSPAEGMRDQYPNQNARVVRSDQQYNLFNIRLHLGGALGGSLYRPETYDRLYLVVSCLLIPQQSQLPVPAPHSRVGSANSSSSYGPPTPITPMTAGPPPSGGLPGFSSIAAGVEAPPQPNQNQRHASAPYNSYFPSRPGSQHQQQAPPLAPSPLQPPGLAPPALVNGQGPPPGVYYPRATPTPQPVASQSAPLQSPMYGKSPSPQSQPQSHGQSQVQTPYAPYSYPSQQPYYPDYRVAEGQEEWRRHPGNGNPPPLQHSNPSSGQPSAASPSTLIQNDYTRRPWES